MYYYFYSSYPMPITNKNDAVLLDGIGDFLANKIEEILLKNNNNIRNTFSDSDHVVENTTKPLKRKRSTETVQRKSKKTVQDIEESEEEFQILPTDELLENMTINPSEWDVKLLLDNREVN